MTTLYELNQDLQTVIDGGFVFNEETGEVIFDQENLDELEMQYADKLEGCAIYYKNLISDSKALRDEEKNLAERRRIIDNKAARMLEYIAQNLNGEKFSTSKVNIKWRKSNQVVIENEMAIPDEYKKVTETPNKAAIAKVLKSGAIVPGATLVEKNNIGIK